MSEFTKNLKAVIQRSAQFIGKNAETAAKNTKYKMSEMSALSKRRELISNLGEKIYELAAQGIAVPEELKDMIAQVNALDANLDTLRADHAAQKAAAAEKAAVEKAERAAQKAAAKAEAATAKGSEPVEIPDAAADAVEEAAAPILDFSCDAATEDAENNSEIPTLNV